MRAKHAITTSNGISACLNVSRSLIPEGSTVLVANTTYYEVALRLFREAKLRQWDLIAFDPQDISMVKSLIASDYSGSDVVVWIDQPSNWWLETTDVRELSAQIKDVGGILIADISVHPFAPVLKQGADVAIVSMSKFPSNGLAQGGLILTDSDSFAEELSRQRDHDASMLAAETAFVINKEILSLEDRFWAISEKTKVLVQEVQKLPGVERVRYPSPSSLETETHGGVFVIEVLNKSVGERAEEILSQNMHRSGFALARICTFGCAHTTFEHFENRGSANDEVVSSLIKPLPENLCRVGVGCESLPAILESLTLIFPNYD